MNEDLHIGELLGHVCQQAAPVYRHNVQGGLEIVLHIPGPMGVDPALRLGTLGQVPRHIVAAALVDRHPKAPCDKPYDLVPGQRVAATGEFDQAIVHTVHQHAAGHPLFGLGGNRRGQFVLRLGRGQLLQAEGLLFDTGQHFPQLDAPIADGRIEVVLGGAVVAPTHAFDHIVHQFPGHADIAALKLPLQLRLSLDDVFIPLFFFKPSADLVPGLAGAHQGEPVPVGAFPRLFGSDDLDDLAGFHLVVQGDDPFVHFGADHPVAHGAVDGIGEVDDRGAHGQVDNVPLGGEYEHFLGDQVAFDRVNKVCNVLAFRLVFQHLADPGQPVIQSRVVRILGGHPQFILPVGRDAVFRCVVHLPGADLHLERHPGLGDHGGVQGLVHIGLGHGNIVFEPVGQGLEHIVDNAQDVIAVLNGIHDDPHRKHIVDLFKALALDEHLPVNAVNALHTAFNIHVGDGDLHPAADHSLGILDELFSAVAAGGEVVLDLLVGQRVQVL